MKKLIHLNNLKISYRETNNHCDQALLFIHGNSFSGDYFNAQLEDKLLSNYHLIAMDLPGHGHSERADAETYSIPGYAKIVSLLINELNLKSVVLVGHSLGGHISLETIARYPSSSYKGVFIWGTPPVGNPPALDQAYHPNPDNGLFFKKEHDDEDRQKLLNICYNKPMQSLDKNLDILRLSDPNARECLLNSVMNLNFIDELNILENSTFDIAVVNCTQDQVISSEYLANLKTKNLWKNQVVKLPEGHAAHVENPALFNDLLNVYSEYSFQQSKTLDNN